jgi:uncharacterized integral membrane protein
MDENMVTETSTPCSAVEEANRADKTKLRVLWAGICLYILIMANALRLTAQLPYQVLVLGGLVNMGIIISMFVAMNKIKRRMVDRRMK